MFLLRTISWYWICSRGYRLRPWHSPYLRWRLETSWGVPAEQLSFHLWCRLLRQHRQEIWRFLRWQSKLRAFLQP